MSSKPAKQASNHPKKPKRLHRHKQASKFAEHIAELRRRLIWVGLVFAIGSVLAYSYRVPLMHAILAPLNGQKLVYLTPGGGFSFIFQISIYSGLIAAAPLLLYHLHAFIKPALPARAQQSAGKIVLAAVALMIGGICYGYFVAVPNALHFLMDFAGDAVTPNLTADSYLSFFLAYTGGLALLALLPLLLMFWHWISPLSPGGLLKSERWVIVLGFVAAAIVTPTPDVVNQTMIAAPVIGLYQLGVFAVLGAIRKTRKAGRIEKNRRQVLEEIEERRLRTLHSRKAYLANATATDIDIEDFLAMVPAAQTQSTSAKPAPAIVQIAQPKAKPATQILITSTPTPTRSLAPATSTIIADIQTSAAAIRAIRPPSNRTLSHQQRLRNAGMSPIARQITPASHSQANIRAARSTSGIAQNPPGATSMLSLDGFTAQ